MIATVPRLAGSGAGSLDPRAERRRGQQGALTRRGRAEVPGPRGGRRRRAYLLADDLAGFRPISPSRSTQLEDRYLDTADGALAGRGSRLAAADGQGHDRIGQVARGAATGLPIVARSSRARPTWPQGRATGPTSTLAR